MHRWVLVLHVAVAEGHASLRKIERLAWAMCAGIAFITALMEAEPTG